MDTWERQKPINIGGMFWSLTTSMQTQLNDDREGERPTKPTSVTKGRGITTNHILARVQYDTISKFQDIIN